MANRVGICAVAQSTYVRNRWDERFQGMALEIVESLQKQTGLAFSEKGGIEAAISVSDDVFDARTISDNAMTDVLGAHHGSEEKVAQDGIQAIYYGLASIMSGRHEVVLILGHSKESQAESRNQVTHLAFDPFFTRPVGLDFLNASALQARAYAAGSKIREDQLARVVVRARELAGKNPFTPEAGPVTEDEVMGSPMIADPIRQLHAYPVSDGAVGLILASEKRARKLCRTPVWISGVGNCMDSFFLGDRDLASNFALKRAAERAYRRAGIENPASAFDVVEVSDLYAYQQPMWLEGLGLCEEGKGGRFIDSGGPDKHHVNLSGGMLAGNPLMIGGLVRAAEAALQLMGKARGRQVPGAKRALAHGVMGPAGQFHSVAVLTRD
jgi:acetyl-CoA C-acetyltransferase